MQLPVHLNPVRGSLEIFNNNKTFLKFSDRKTYFFVKLVDCGKKQTNIWLLAHLINQQNNEVKDIEVWH